MYRVSQPRHRCHNPGTGGINAIKRLKKWVCHTLLATLYSILESSMSSNKIGQKGVPNSRKCHAATGFMPVPRLCRDLCRTTSQTFTDIATTR